MTGAIFGLVGSILSWVGTQLATHWEHRREVELINLMKDPSPKPDAYVIPSESRDKIIAAREKTFARASQKGGSIAALVILLVRPVITFIAIGVFFYYLVAFDEYTWPPFAYDVIFFVVTYYFGDRTLRKR